MEKLGVFDSGLGGFNVVYNLRQHSNLDIVFLADHKNLPYGEKSSEQLKEILLKNMQWFDQKGINHVLIACNTASAYVEYLRDEMSHMQIDSIIEITSKQFTDEDLVIFGTSKTVENKKYDELLNKEHDYVALSELATLVEANDEYVIEQYLKKVLKNIKRDQNFLLACTHYSICDDIFKRLLSGVYYDSIQPVIDYYENTEGSSTLEIYTSGNIKVLSDQIFKIFKYDYPVLPYLDNYKMVIVSDNHGLYDPIYNVLNNNQDASVFIHCGDVELNDSIMDRFYTVNGNNDYYVTYPNNITLDIYNLKFYITHSHEYMRHSRYFDLAEKAKQINADVVFYGHEHIYKELIIDDVVLLNPGSLFYNRDQSKTSYAIVHVNGNEIEIKHVENEG